jgi:hypothetical protein
MSKNLVKAALVDALRDTGNYNVVAEYDDVIEAVAEHLAFKLADARQVIYYEAVGQKIDPRLAHVALVKAGLAEHEDQTAYVIAGKFPLPPERPVYADAQVTKEWAGEEYNGTSVADKVEEAQAKQRGLFSRIFGVR